MEEEKERVERENQIFEKERVERENQIFDSKNNIFYSTLTQYREISIPGNQIFESEKKISPGAEIRVCLLKCPFIRETTVHIKRKFRPVSYSL